MSRRAGRLGAVIILVTPIFGGACGAAEPEVTTVPVARRSDPQPYVPPPVDGPTKSGRMVGVTALVPQDDVRAAALNFLRGWINEDIEALMEFIGDDFSLGTTGRTLPRQVLREAWLRQFALLDYTQFTLDEIIDRDAFEVIPYGEQQLSGGNANWLRTGDLLVRLTMRVTRRNRRRYFDNTIELWFRQVGGRWQIVALGR
jgi:hypothetical protein